MTRRAGRVGRATSSRAAGARDPRWDRNARVEASDLDEDETLGRDRNGLHGVRLAPGGGLVKTREGVALAGQAPAAKFTLSPLEDRTTGTVVNSLSSGTDSASLLNALATILDRQKKLEAVLRAGGLVE